MLIPEATPDVAYDFRARLIELIPALRAFARSLCINRTVADDLVQESITNAWQARASFQPGTNLKAWLFVIQRNAFYSTHRRKARQVDWDEDAMERLLVAPGAQQANAELTDLTRTMALLPDDQREALILVGAGGFSYMEAAAICGCAIGTMKSRVCRARQAIVLLMDQGVRLPATRRNGGDGYDGITNDLAALVGHYQRSANVSAVQGLSM